LETVSRIYELPYPPSVNHYWRRVGQRTLISREGRRYRTEVVALLTARRVRPLSGRLIVQVTVHPPDYRRRDLDNVQKALLDALQQGGAFHDDGQIDELVIKRGAVVPTGRMIVTIAEIHADGASSISA
jgi:crossover junction endodeoxyribonuclease RusA